MYSILQTSKVPVNPLSAMQKFVADILNFFIYCLFSEKISLDILCESSAWQMIHMKCQGFILWKK